METNVSFVTARNSSYCPCVRIKIPCSILKYVVVNYWIRVNQIFSSKHLHYLSYNKKKQFYASRNRVFSIPSFWEGNKANSTPVQRISSKTAFPKLSRFEFRRFSGNFNSDEISVSLSPFNKAVQNTDVSQQNQNPTLFKTDWRFHGCSKGLPKKISNWRVLKKGAITKHLRRLILI